jgi:hypothetical protein
MPETNSMLLGAVAMATFLATLFFLRFWRQTRDRLFLFFAVAFGVETLIRILIGLHYVSTEQEPFVYLARLIAYGSIVLAIVQKNRPQKSDE